MKESTAAQGGRDSHLQCGRPLWRATRRKRSDGDSTPVIKDKIQSRADCGFSGSDKVRKVTFSNLLGCHSGAKSYSDGRSPARHFPHDESQGSRARAVSVNTSTVWAL